MRELTSHKLTGLNEEITIKVLDEPGPGGANHHYQLSTVMATTDISFQRGFVSAGGVNGISNEALLAIIIDRMEGFQSGQYACRENDIALTKLQEAMHWLQHRTRLRLARGVEGSPQV